MYYQIFLKGSVFPLCVAMAAGGRGLVATSGSAPSVPVISSVLAATWPTTTVLTTSSSASPQRMANNGNSGLEKDHSFVLMLVSLVC